MWGESAILNFHTCFFQNSGNIIENILEFFGAYNLRLFCHFVRLSNMAARFCSYFKSSAPKIHILQRFTYCTQAKTGGKFDTSVLDILVCPLSKEPLRCAKFYQISYFKNIRFVHVLRTIKCSLITINICWVFWLTKCCYWQLTIGLNLADNQEFLYIFNFFLISFLILGMTKQIMSWWMTSWTLHIQYMMAFQIWTQIMLERSTKTQKSHRLECQ
jgi:uncharacterized protein YbaR (Trm112 family)